MHRHLCLMAPAALLLLACAEKPRAPEPGPRALPTFTQFRASHPSGAFQASPERRGAVLGGLALVRPGMSKPRVAQILGRPDWTTELSPKGPPARAPITEWMYLLSSADLNFVNERTDQRVHVFFSSGNLVTDVVRVNLGEAPDSARPPGT